MKVKYKVKPWVILSREDWKVGLLVRRGPDWAWAEQDYHHGRPATGVISRVLEVRECGDLGIVVIWENGETNSYWGGGLNHSSKPVYDLRFLKSKDEV